MYEECRRRGESHRLAEMFAFASPPAGRTDREFLEGHCNGSQFAKTPGLGDFYAREALSAGVDPKGKVYLSGLARFPGDPEAWVEGRGDLKRVCERRGWACEGAVSVAARPPEESPWTGGGLASDIVDRLTAARLAEDPSARPEEVRERVIDDHAPRWAKRETSVEA